MEYAILGVVVALVIGAAYWIYRAGQSAATAEASSGANEEAAARARELNRVLVERAEKQRMEDRRNGEAIIASGDAGAALKLLRAQTGAKNRNSN